MQPGPDPVTVVVGPASLRELVEDRGFSLSRVEVLADLPASLLVRVDAGRQPMPIEASERVAQVLGVSVGDVEAASRLVTRQRGPIYLAPLPPDPFRGDPIPSLSIARTNVPVVPGAQVSSVQLWVLMSASMRRYDPSSGALLAEVSFVDDIGPLDLTKVGTQLWTCSTQDNGFGEVYVVAVDTATATVAVEFADPALPAYGVGMRRPIVDPATGFLLFAPIGYPGGAFIIDQETGVFEGIVEINRPPLVQAVDFAACNERTFGVGDEVDGCVFRLDAENAVSDLFSSGATIDVPTAGIAADDEGTLWVVTQGGNLFSMSADDLVATAVPVVGGSIGSPTDVAWFAGHLWVVSLVGMSLEPQLIKLSGGSVVASRAFSAPLSKPVYDGTSLWVVEGLNVHRINPADISTSTLTFSTIDDGAMALAFV